MHRMRIVRERVCSSRQPQRRLLLVSVRLDGGGISSQQSGSQAQLVWGEGQSENGQEQS